MISRSPKIRPIGSFTYQKGFQIQTAKLKMLLGLYRNEFITDFWKISSHLKIKCLGLKGELFPTKDRSFANKAGFQRVVMVRLAHSPCYSSWDAKPGNLSLGVWLQVFFLHTYCTYMHTYIHAHTHTNTHAYMCNTYTHIHNFSYVSLTMYL